MTVLRSVVFTLACYATFHSDCHAEFVTIIGDISASDFSANLTPDPFVATWTLETEVSRLTGGGFYFGVPLTSFTPTTIGNTVYDQSNVGMNLLIGGDDITVELFGSPFAKGLSFRLDDFVASYSGSVSGLLNGSEFGLSSLSIANTSVAVGSPSTLGGSFSIDSNDSSAVPEPSSYALLALGAFGLTVWQLRRKRLSAKNRS